MEQLTEAIIEAANIAIPKAKKTNNQIQPM